WIRLKDIPRNRLVRPFVLYQDGLPHNQIKSWNIGKIIAWTSATHVTVKKFLPYTLNYDETDVSHQLIDSEQTFIINNISHLKLIPPAHITKLDNNSWCILDDW